MTPTSLIPPTFPQKPLGGNVHLQYPFIPKGRWNCQYPFWALETVSETDVSPFRRGRKEVRMRKKKTLGLEGKRFLYPSLPQKVKGRPTATISMCFLYSMFGLDAFSLLCLGRKGKRKRKLPMNISCRASADFWVPCTPIKVPLE